MGFFDRVFNRNSQIEIMNDLSLYDEDAKRTSLKRVAIESVIGMMSRTIIQSEFRIQKDGKYIKDSTYYKFNIKPNKNQSASSFWGEVTKRLVYDGECLIVKSRTDDLLIADDFQRSEYAVYEDTFSHVYIKGLELDGTFTRSEVIYLEYGNEKLSALVDSLFYDFGELFNRLIETQMMKNQIRATVDVEAVVRTNKDGSNPLQNFIDRAYNRIKNSTIAIMPQQKGLEYKEHSGRASTSGESIEEVDKLTQGFVSQVALSVGMPVSFLKGDMADIDKITRNYMKFCIDPIIKIIDDELNRQFVKEKDYLKGDGINVKRVSYRDMFDHAIAADKIRSSSIADGHELRDELGLEHSDDPIHDKFILTKNYTDADESEELEE